MIRSHPLCSLSSPLLLLIIEVPPPSMRSSIHVVTVDGSRSETTAVRCTNGKLFVSNITYGVLQDLVHEDVEHELLKKEINRMGSGNN